MQRAIAAAFGIALVWTVLVSEASAQDEMAPRAARGAFGLGAAAMLNMPHGIQLVYDPGAWHLEVITGLSHNGGTDIAAGARFYYHVHTAQAADFSLGGGAAFRSRENNDNTVHAELSAQIRAFIVSNVALSGALGIGIMAADRSGVVLTGQPVGALAITYFF